MSKKKSVVVEDKYKGEQGAPFDEPLPELAPWPSGDSIYLPADAATPKSSKEKKKQHLISVPADLYETISRDAREGHRPLSWQIRLYVEAFRQDGN